MTDGQRRVGAVLYTLLLLMGIDLLVGIWLALHSERALEIFLGLLPLLGAAGIVWSFLPKTFKDDFGDALVAFLGHRVTQVAVTILAIPVIAFTVFRASVTIAAIDGNIATQVYLATAADLAHRGDSVAPSDSARLNSLTSPVSFVRRSWPGDRRAIWIYTPAAITKVAQTVRPWQPRRLQYPQDFDSLATVAVLPGAWLFGQIGSDVILTLHEPSQPGETVAQVTIDTKGGYLVTFLNPGSGPLLTKEALTATLSETRDFARPSMVDRWMKTSWTSTRRPLRKGDLLEWQLIVPGDSLRQGTLRVNDVVTHLYLPN